MSDYCWQFILSVGICLHVHAHTRTDFGNFFLNGQDTCIYINKIHKK
jgi:hypothetical protein